MRGKILGIIILSIVVLFGVKFVSNLIANKTGEIIDQSFDKALNANYEVE